MMQSTTIPISNEPEELWKAHSRGVVAMWCLIAAEAAIFLIFVVAYVFYIGKSLNGPYPGQVLKLPILGTICLLSSSITVHFATGALHKGSVRGCTLGLAATVLLGMIFLWTTAMEWRHLIYDEGLTIKTNLFGTTNYSLVGLHASHVIVGLTLLLTTLLFSVAGRLTPAHGNRLEVISLYWHFVDAVWIVVFLVVYVLGR